MAIHPPLRRNFLFSPPTPLHFVSEYGTIIKPLPRRPTQNSTRSGRLAQLVEHLLDVQEVTGSSPVPSTKTKPRGQQAPGFLFCTGIAEAHPVRVLYCCASEALPAAEAAELEQGPRSEFSSALHARRKFRAPQPDPPNKAYPNPILYEEGFGYVFSLPEVLRRGQRTAETA